MRLLGVNSSQRMGNFSGWGIPAGLGILADGSRIREFFAGVVCTKASSQRTHKVRKDRT